MIKRDQLFCHDSRLPERSDEKRRADLKLGGAFRDRGQLQQRRVVTRRSAELFQDILLRMDMIVAPDRIEADLFSKNRQLDDITG